MDNIKEFLTLAETSLLNLLVIVILVEQATQYSKAFVGIAMKKLFKDSTQEGDELKPEVKLALSFAISLAVCFSFQIKISEALNINVYLNYLAAAIVCGGGSQAWHSLLGFVRSVKTSVETANPMNMLKK